MGHSAPTDELSTALWVQLRKVGRPLTFAEIVDGFDTKYVSDAYRGYRAKLVESYPELPDHEFGAKTKRLALEWYVSEALERARKNHWVRVSDPDGGSAHGKAGTGSKVWRHNPDKVPVVWRQVITRKLADWDDQWDGEAVARWAAGVELVKQTRGVDLSKLTKAEAVQMLDRAVYALAKS